MQAKRGAPKFKPLLELLEDPSIKHLTGQLERRLSGDYERELLEPLYFTVNEKSRIVDLNSQGRMQLAPALMDELAKADLAWEHQQIEENSEFTPEEQAQALRELEQSYDSFSILDVDEQVRRVEARTDLDEEEQAQLIARIPPPGGAAMGQE